MTLKTVARRPLPNCVLVAARSADYAQLARWVQTADECRRWAGPDLAWPIDEADLGQRLQRPNQNSRSLIDSQRKLVGFGQYYSRRPGSLRLARLIVHPDYRGAGLAARLVELLIADAHQEQAFDTVELGVYPDNTPAIAAYRRMGFADCDDPSQPEVISMRRYV